MIFICKFKNILNIDPILSSIKSAKFELKLEFELDLHLSQKLICKLLKANRVRLSAQILRPIIIVIYIAVPMLCTPFYLNSTVAEYSASDRELCGFDNATNFTAFTIIYNPLAVQTGLLRFNFYFFSIACKLIPCLVVVGANLYTVYKIRRFQVQRRRSEIFSNNQRALKNIENI